PTTTSAGRGWVCRSSATTSGRAAPVRPATRRQTSPSANDFASASKAGHSLSIPAKISTLSRHSTLAGGGRAAGVVGERGSPRPRGTRPLPVGGWAPSGHASPVAACRERGLVAPPPPPPPPAGRLPPPPRR